MKALSQLINRLRPAPGNVMVWLVVVMLVFAILGVTMVSLFSTSISSTAVQNDTRRAVYLSESGIRYAQGQLWSSDFSKNTIKDELNGRTFTVSQAGTFIPNIISPWFNPVDNIDLLSGSKSQIVELFEGNLANGFSKLLPASPPFLSLVNYDYIDSSTKPNPQASARVKVISSAAVLNEPTQLQLEINDDGDSDGFVANEKETLCLAVQPTADKNITAFPGSLDVEYAAAGIFPKHGGAFEMNRQNFYYDRAIDRGTHVELTGIRPVAMGGTLPTSIDAKTSDYVILTPRNRFIVAEGTSGNVAFGNHMDHAASIADTTMAAPKSRKPDIEFEEEDSLTGVLSRIYDSGRYSSFLSVNEDEKALRLGGTGPTFGAVWFKPLQPRSIGGQRNFCTSNGCLFGSGIRVFYTLEYTGTGEGLDGIVFALLNGNPSKNDAASAGGDSERSELLGYAGDSRLKADADPLNPDDFLDNSPGLGEKVRGLRPPKIGLEFDNRVNRNDDFERSLKYCGSSTSLDPDTRNDPGEPSTDNRDAVQYIFWANSSLDVPCRREPFCQGSPPCLGDPSYDDNRHDAVSGVDAQANWPFEAGGSIENSPSIGPGPDLTVYFGTTTTNFKLYAVRPNGSKVWDYPTSGTIGKVHPQTVSGGGSIFFGSGSGSTSGLFHGVTSGGDDRFAPVNVFGQPNTKPAIDSEGTIYLCTNNNVTAVGRVYAFRPDGTLKSGWPVINNPVPIASVQIRAPALSPSGSKLIVASSDGFIRGLNTSDGGIDFEKSISGFSGSPSDPVVVSDGDGSYNIYIRDNNRIFKLDADGDIIWTSPSLPHSGSLSTAPVVGSTDSVYVGGFDGYLYAVSATNGAKKWEYRTLNSIQSTPAVDGNGHIYFGSDDDHVYALTDQSTGAALKWRYPAEGQLTFGDVRGTPALKGDGTVYVGTTGFRLYAINQFDGPKNYKDRLITSYPGSPPKVGGTSEASREGVVLQDEEDWLKGAAGRQWAVRMEVTRSQTAAADGSFEYTLETWVRQCNLIDCGDVLGSFFSDTRIDYAPAEHPVQLQQNIKLRNPVDPNEPGHNDFERFLFGFTAATASAQAQTANIRKFQLSFIRPNDPVIDSDPWNP